MIKLFKPTKNHDQFDSVLLYEYELSEEGTTAFLYTTKGHKSPYDIYHSHAEIEDNIARYKNSSPRRKYEEVDPQDELVSKVNDLIKAYNEEQEKIKKKLKTRKYR